MVSTPVLRTGGAGSILAGGLKFLALNQCGDVKWGAAVVMQRITGSECQCKLAMSLPLIPT